MTQSSRFDPRTNLHNVKVHYSLNYLKSRYCSSSSSRKCQSQIRLSPSPPDTTVVLAPLTLALLARGALVPCWPLSDHGLNLEQICIEIWGSNMIVISFTFTRCTAIDNLGWARTASVIITSRLEADWILSLCH